ncbi:hypothetical protein KCU70_g156, partial [Aureobasidium melanogenum]
MDTSLSRCLDRTWEEWICREFLGPRAVHDAQFDQSDRFEHEVHEQCAGTPLLAPAAGSASDAEDDRIVRGARARRRCGMAWQDHSELFVVDTDNTPCAHALFVCAAESRPPRPWQALLLASESCLACHSPLLRNHPAFWPIVLRVQDEEHGRWFLVAGLPG